MSMTQKRRVGALFSIVALCIVMLSTVTYASDAVTAAGRFGAPGFPAGLNTTEKWGQSYGVLGGVILQYVSTDDYSVGTFLNSVSVTSAEVRDNGATVLYHIHSTIPIKKMRVVIPIHVFSDNNQAASYSFGAVRLDSTPDGYTASYNTTIASTTTARAYYPGGDFMLSLPDNVATGYVVIDWNYSTARTDWDLGARAKSPADAWIDGNHDNIAVGVYSVLNNEGVTAVGNYVVEFTALTWVLPFLSVTVLLILVALLLNFLLSL